MTACTVELRHRHTGQAEIVGEAKRFNVLMCGRRFGKTALGIDLATEAALDGKRVAWFAPTYKYLEEAWREIVQTLAPIPEVDKSEQQHRVALPTGGVIECWTLDSDDPARGRYYDLAIIDEAGLVPTLARIWHSAIRPTLVDRQGGAWFLGTPKVTGDFTALWALGQDPLSTEWMSWRLPMSANPYISLSEIDAMRVSMPEADFRREVLGEPVDDGEHPIGLEHIRACLGPLSEAEPVVWGVDLARAVDFTVAIGLDAGGHTCRVERWKTDWGLTKGRLRSIIGTDVTAYGDSTGVGDPVVEDLRRMGVKMVPCVFTARSKQQWVEGLITGIQQHRVRFPDGWLKLELDTLTAERTAVGTRYAAPDGLHDDGVMALALAWFGYARSGYPRPEPTGLRVKQDDRAPHFDYEKRRFDRTTVAEAVDRELGKGQRSGPWPHRVPRRNVTGSR